MTETMKDTGTKRGTKKGSQNFEKIKKLQEYINGNNKPASK